MDIPFGALSYLEILHAELPPKPITLPYTEPDLGKFSSSEEGKVRWPAGKKREEWSSCTPALLKCLLTIALCTQKSSAPVEDKYLLQLTDIFA